MQMDNTIKKQFGEKEAVIKKNVVDESMQSNKTSRQINNEGYWKKHQEKVKNIKVNTLDNLRFYQIKAGNIKVLGFFEHKNIIWVKYFFDEKNFMWETGFFISSQLIDHKNVEWIQFCVISPQVFKKMEDSYNISWRGDYNKWLSATKLINSMLKLKNNIKENPEKVLTNQEQKILTDYEKDMTKLAQEVHVAKGTRLGIIEYDPQNSENKVSEIVKVVEDLQN